MTSGALQSAKRLVGKDVRLRGETGREPVGRVPKGRNAPRLRGGRNSDNELTARTNPSISLTYDDAGNLTQDGDSDGDHKFSWDYRNRLIEVEEKQSGNWNTVAEYRYDASNRRILKTVTNKGDLNGTTRFLWGGQSDWQCLEERDGSGDLVARYTYATTYIDAVAVQERDLNGDDDFADNDEVVYYHSNTLYSIYALTDDGENVVERMRYNAYGAATVLDSDFSSDADGASDVENPYRLTARRLDLESDLMQYRNRYYDPALGRFISRDPREYVDGMDLYLYAMARPTWGKDPLGTVTEDECWRRFQKCFWDRGVYKFVDCCARAAGTGAGPILACVSGVAAVCGAASLATGPAAPPFFAGCFTGGSTACFGVFAFVTLYRVGQCLDTFFTHAKECLKMYQHCMNTLAACRTRDGRPVAV